jgi:CRP/FNR family transcriptional regulator
LPGVPAAAAAEAAAGARLVTFAPGETIMGDGLQWSPAVVTEGRVRLTIRSHDGREATLRQIGKGVYLGLIALIDPGYSHPIPERSVVAVERSTLVFFDTDVFAALASRHPDFAMHLLRLLVEWGSALADAAGRYAFMSVRQRVAAHLLGVASADIESPDTPVAQLTQQQLADAIGSVREVVARTLRELRLAGLISVSRARITILDRPRLEREAFTLA